MRSFRNISVATTDLAAELLGGGARVEVRGEATRELVGCHNRIERPLERHLFVPERNDDVFAQIAETLWVLAGRNDVAWLARYLPRAPEFSDDGGTWRAAYGPRLRDWQGRDQVDEVRKLLRADPATRRAVLSLFDPARDFVSSKDVPCTNWLGWLIRDDRLHMSVVLRSNDLMWGFSGVNSFEWSVLQEMLAFWLGVEVGPADYLAMSLHLYERHLTRASRMAEAAHGLSPYDFGIARAAFCTPWSEFDGKLARWFDIEAAIAAEPDRPVGSHGAVGDPFLDGAISLMHLRWASEIWGDDRLAEELGRLPPTDQVLAAYLRLGRSRPALLKGIGQPAMAAFLAASAAPRGGDRSAPVKAAIKRLHAEKNRAYGGSWKRRGELVSIQPNMARKVDRLEALIATSASISGESALDTAVDLFVYVEKYRLFLAEEMPPASLLPTDASLPLSEHDANLNLLVDRWDLAASGRPAEVIVPEITSLFERCWRRAEGRVSVEERFALASLLSKAAGELLACLVHRDQVAVAQFLPHRTRDMTPEVLAGLRSRLLESVLKVGPGARVAVVGWSAAAVEIAADPVFGSGLASLTGHYAHRRGGPLIPLADLGGAPPDIVVIAEDEGKEALLDAVARLVPASTTLVIEGFGHFGFKDEVFDRVRRDGLVPSLANGYPHCLVHIYQCLRNAHARGVDGVVAEFGMFKGGTTMLISRFIEELGASWKVIGFDTFDGFPPKRSPLDMYAHPDCVFLDVGAIRRLFADRNVEIVEGDVVETASRLADERIVLSFVDTDNYTSANAILEVVADRTQVGGAIVFDHWTGIDRHLDTIGERMAARRLAADPRFFNLHGTGVFLRQQ